MRWTKHKKIALSIGLGFLVLTGPIWLCMASNAGAAILSLFLEREPARLELIGDYTYAATWGSAALHLSPEGTFTQTVTVNGSSPKQYSGLWAAATDDNSAKVRFRPFDMVWDDNHGTETDFFSMNFYRRRLGNTYAIVDDDLGEQFRRR